MKQLLIILSLLVGTHFGYTQNRNHGNTLTGTPVVIAKKMAKNENFRVANNVIRDLWYAHMYWTLITVDAYFNDPKGLNAKLSRLLQNQKDIGASIVPFYGQAAGDQLAKLLTEHIEGAVPVLQAAKENNSSALDKAVKKWYDNAKEIGEFLHNVNPKNWSAEVTGGALENHISHTIDYSVSILKGDYTQSFGGFEHALQHMVSLADLLTVGLYKQFPKQFK